MNHWWRAYNEAVNDPKLQLISDALFRAWFNLMCITSANEGVLPPINSLAFILRMKPDRVGQVLTQLHVAGLLDKTDTGFIPHNWNGRQYKTDVTDPTAAKRMQRYRDNKRNERNATVTHKRPETEQIQNRTEALPSVAEGASEKPKSKKRAVPLPASWAPSERAYEIAEQFGQNVQIVEGIFRDYLASSGKMYADYDAAFHNFIRNQSSFNRGTSNGIRQPENRGSIIRVADRAIAKLEREIAADHQIRADAFFSLPQE